VRSLLPDELAEEKGELLDEGFGNWSRSQFFHFVKCNGKYGRDDIASIAAELDMSEEQVRPYSVAFWKYGPTELKGEWERFTNMIERGEKKLEKQKKLTQTLKQFVSTFDDPRRELVFANKGTTHFALEQDRALLCAVDAGGYGNWDTVRENLRKDRKLKFQHSVQGMTTAMITKRADYRIRQVERELEAREKALEKLRPPSAIAAQKAIDAIKSMEKYEVEARAHELQGEEPPKIDTFDSDTKSIYLERQKEKEQCVRRLREIEGQVSRCLLLADETRQGILRGDQYVNFSNINLKGGTKFTTAGGEYTFEVLPELESGVIEARINRAILSIPECGQCENCINKGTVRRLCVRRLEERKRLIRNETKAVLKKLGKSTANIKPGMITTTTVVPKKDNKSSSSNSSNGGSSSSKKRKTESNDADASKKPKTAPAPKKKSQKMMMTASGMKPRVTSQGNKRMSIPDEVFPEFCRRIGPYGTGERMKLITQFAEDHPETSIRQVTLKLGEITCKEPPACVDMTGRKVRAFMFYLRPRYYKYLYPEDRPDNWEKFAAFDDQLWEMEKEQKRLKEEKALKRAAEAADGESISSDRLESASNVSPSVTGDDDGDETEDEGGNESAAKRLKVGY